MARVHISRLLPGMVIESDVYNDADQLVLPEGLKLNDKSIAKLTYYGIEEVHIKDDDHSLFGEEIEEAPALEETSYAQRVMQSEEFKEFQEKFDTAVNDVQGYLSDIVEKNMPPDTTDILASVSNMLHPASGDVNVFDMIHHMRSFDDMTYVHCLNVGLICNVFAKWMGLSKEEQDLVTECGILHDLGKLKISADIIKKPGKLTDDEFKAIKKHPQNGYEILKKGNVNQHIMNAALMHHEKCDGTGYPLGLKANQIDSYAKMVCIADIYEAMTATRIYRGSLSPFQVIETFEREGLQKYDTKMIMTFLENITNTYMLNRVRLSDGREGDIVFINKQKYSRPTIKSGDEFIDLMKEPQDVYIVAIL